MSTYQGAEALKSLTLGQTTEYSSEYNPKLLQAVPRSLNRDDLALSNDNLPFYGEDVWYGYELSWLTPSGKPVVAVAEFRFPCSSVNIVESKSFKLYLNSFNQSRFDSWQQVQETLISDLSALVEAPAQVTLSKVDDCPALVIAALEGQCIDDIDITIDDYQFNPEHLAESAPSQSEQDNAVVEQTLVSHLLKSNCLITNQPDWASVYISYRGTEINQQALLKYLISFRQHNEFHEQCVERIFCDIQKYCQPQQLTVYARYTRRGGLDINPFRSTENISAPNARGLRQ
ncbi:NADPH-dependent 7-cyano-7-deazaguanine reductase QueF [Endozoicomonas sp. G2_1]|uniref:NADPH-dependent 7-cyano-7-deazaguanine reductase QueF n=1 Tax=Endozoicomonas sp. G2_1 TaxID=2821091 RepID=UPI001AD9E969|nr:NADPH-dependent 7-cyano-7-deazaguanine reductase QueF [Endozoicomonas sp. G2_1]MBO9488889.1 NADPH-dependent 7-cyano-7-deazaguanine reductase QueF [Endozoicomonas sp. G2_1]